MMFDDVLMTPDTPNGRKMEHTNHAAFLIFQLKLSVCGSLCPKTRFTASKAQLACSKEDPVTR